MVEERTILYNDVLLPAIFMGSILVGSLRIHRQDEMKKITAKLKKHLTNMIKYDTMRVHYFIWEQTQILLTFEEGESR